MRKHKSAGSLLAIMMASIYGQPGLAVPMDPEHRHAWAENAGWISQRETLGEVQVYADHLEGYAWAESIGWIRFGSHSGGGSHAYANQGAEDWGVNRAADGSLSGFAWSENVGWIDFAPAFGGVSIELGSGAFRGHAWSESIGWIRFGEQVDGYHAALALSDITVVQIADASPIRAGTDLTYTMTITNLSENDAEAVTSRLALTPGVSLLSVTGDCAEGGDGVPSCSIGTLGAGESRDYTVRVRIAPTTSGELTSPVEVVALNGDPDLANNLASVITQVPVDWDNDALPDAWDTYPETVHTNACSGSQVNFDDWIIRSGDVVVCRASESIQMGSSVRVEAGGTLAMASPSVGVAPGFESHPQSRFRAVAAAQVEARAKTKSEIPQTTGAGGKAKPGTASSTQPSVKRLSPNQLPAQLLSQLGKDGLPEQAYSDADGRYIVFQSARQLLPQDTNGSEDVYLYRVQEEELLLASKSVEGLVGNAGSQEPAMDAHGSYVVFSSLANNLVEGDSNGVSDIYLYYTDFDYLTRVSLSADGELSKPSRRPALDANGVQLLYEYGEDGSREILVADPLQPDLGSRLASPDSAQGDHHHPGISPNGRYATWISESRDGCTLTIQDRIEGSAWQQTCPFGEGVERIDSPWFDEKKESPAILWRTTYADESVMEYRVEHE